jgi:uncharacterized protein
MDMRELVELITKKLVDHPDQVSVNEVKGEHTNVIELRVAHSDIGKVIGKRGNTISAIRTILSNVGMKRGCRYVVEILEDGE